MHIQELKTEFQSSKGEQDVYVGQTVFTFFIREVSDAFFFKFDLV